MQTLLEFFDSVDPVFWWGLLLVVIIGASVFISRWLRRPNRAYVGPDSVSQIYDEWTQDRFVEHYWGGHLHAGHYGDPPGRKDFIRAKDDMIDEMLRWGLGAAEDLRARLISGEGEVVTLLDVGCGLGGTVRRLAKRWPERMAATGLTLSEVQARRAAVLAAGEGLENTAFVVGDALVQPFQEGSFDIVWTLEAEPHIPDNEVFIREMVRLLKPGGVLVMGTWNVRDHRERPLTAKEQETVQFLLDEWNHANFSSIPDCVGLMEDMGLVDVVAEDWAAQTVPTWRESIIEPYRRPGLLLEHVRTQFATLLRNGYTLMRYDGAFREGLLEYGLFRGRK